VPELIKTKRVDSTNALSGDLDPYFITVRKLEALCGALGMRIVSNVEELNPDSTVIFASPHDNYNEPKELKEILLQKLNSCDKKVILGLEFFSDKYFEDLLNDPKRNLNDEHFNKIISFMTYGKTVSGLVKAFNEIQKEYPRERFEIKPFDLGFKEAVLPLKHAEETGDKEEVKEYYKSRNAKIVEKILDLLKIYGGDDNLVVYTGTFHIVDLLTKLKEIIESGNKDGIKINNIVVFLTPEDLATLGSVESLPEPI